MRQSAVDMENTQNLLEGEDAHTIIYKSRKKYLTMICFLGISYAMFFSLGFYAGYMNEVCDGSKMF